MTGRFIFRPILGIAATVMIFGAPLVAADVDKLTTEQFQMIRLAFNETKFGANTEVDALSAEAMQTVLQAFQEDMTPALTFAAAQTIVPQAQ